MKKKKLLFLLTLANCLLCMQCSQKPEEVIIRPQILAWDQTSLEVDTVFRTDTATILDIQAYYRPNFWIKIASESFLTDNLGNKYPIQKGIGIELDKEFWMPESGNATFRLMFPPLNPKATSIDFSEGNIERSFKLWGIQLTNQKHSLVNLPDIPETKSMNNLPTPTFRYGKGTLKGQILGYRPEMKTQANLMTWGVIQDEVKEYELKIAEDGTFTISIPAVTVTPCTLHLPYGQFKCLIAPEETTNLYIHLAEATRRQSKLRAEEPAQGKPVYFDGYLAALQQEINDSNLLDYVYFYNEGFDKIMEDIADMKPMEFKEYLLEKMQQKQEKIKQAETSEALKKLCLIALQLSTANTWTQGGITLQQAHAIKHKLRDEEARKYFQTPFILPEEFFEGVDQLPLLYAPQAVYSGLLNTWVSQMIYFKPELTAVKQDKLMQSYITANKLARSIANFIPLTEDDRKQMQSLPEAFQQMLEAQHKELLEKIEANKRSVDINLHEVDKVKKEDVLPGILSNFRGHTLLIDFWATWCGPCKMAHKSIKPLKEAWKDKDIIYIYIAGENSPLGSWQNMITEIEGEHYRLTQEQWDYLYRELGIQGVPTYLFVNKQGTIIDRSTGFSGADAMKQKLEKAMK